MKPTRFMRIPFFVTGYQVTDEDMDVIAKWCDGYVNRNTEKPFIRVPVSRVTNEKYTRAYPGMWIIGSKHRGERSFKVFTEEWLKKQFTIMPDDVFDEIAGIDPVVETPVMSTPAIIRGMAKVLDIPSQNRQRSPRSTAI